MIGYKKQERILICDQKDKMLAEPPKENPTSIDFRIWRIQFSSTGTPEGVQKAVKAVNILIVSTIASITVANLALRYCKRKCIYIEGTTKNNETPNCPQILLEFQNLIKNLKKDSKNEIPNHVDVVQIEEITKAEFGSLKDYHHSKVEEAQKSTEHSFVFVCIPETVKLNPDEKESRLKAMIRRKAFTSYGTGAFFQSAFIGFGSTNLFYTDQMIRFCALCFYNSLDQSVYEDQKLAKNETERVNHAVIRDSFLYASLLGNTRTQQHYQNLFQRVISYRHGVAAHSETYGLGQTDKRGRKLPSYSVNSSGDIMPDVSFQIMAEEVCLALNIVGVINNYALVTPSKTKVMVCDFNADLHSMGHIENNDAKELQNNVINRGREARAAAGKFVSDPKTRTTAKPDTNVLVTHLLSAARSMLCRASQAESAVNRNSFVLNDKLAYEIVAVCSFFQALKIARENKIWEESELNTASGFVSRKTRNHYTHFGVVDYIFKEDCSLTKLPGADKWMFYSKDQNSVDKVRLSKATLVDLKLFIDKKLTITNG